MRTNDRGVPQALLAAAARALDEEDLDAVGDGALATQLRGLWVAISRLQAQVSRRIAVFEERRVAARDGARSSRAWLRYRLRVDGAEAARQSTVAAAMGRRPLTARAYLRGEISADHVAAIAEADWQLGDAVMARGAERMLLDRARRETPGRVRRLARRLRGQADPVGDLRDHRQARDQRWFEAVRTTAGALAVRGQLDAADAELLLVALAAQRTGADSGAARTPAQRHADALVAACRTALRADLRHNGDRPRVVVTVALHTLAAPLPTRTGAGGGAGAGHAAGGAFAGSGEPLPAETARRLACDARVVPAVLGQASEPLDIGAETETISQGLRRALELRDRGCRFPGCDALAAECEAHHVLHWAHGGSSTMDNVLLLCPHHHVLSHEGRWQVARDPYSGEVRARRPDGTRLDAVSPPPEG